jgi:hypothetical protein
MLRDLTSCGSVHLRLDNGAARLTSVCEAWSADVSGPLARLDGPGTRLAGLVTRWGGACLNRPCPSRPFEHLEINDQAGERLLRISLTEDSSWPRFHSLLVRQWGRRAVPTAIPDTTQVASEVARLQAFADFDMAGPLADTWFDLAPPACAGTPIDTTLLAPFFEALADALCPIGLLVGNPGITQYRESALFDVHVEASCLRLRDSSSEFALDLAQTTTACVVDSPGCLTPPYLRLFDGDGHCVTSLRLARQANADDHATWRGLVRALPY